jgi:hypothetical protein
MKWIGTKCRKETLTDDGYLLQIRFIEKLDSYWWGTYLNGKPIAVAKSENDLKRSLSSAQKAAQKMMIKDLMSDNW